MLTPIKHLARTLLPKAAQNQLYRAAAFSYVDSLDPTIDPTQKTILALNHFCDQDIRALGRACRQYNLVEIDAPRLVRGARLYYDIDVIQLNSPYSTSSPESRGAWKHECRQFLDRLKSRFGLDLIVAPADCFWWIREMIVSAREMGIRTVVIDKEGIISPYDFEAAARRIRLMAPFMSDHLFVWSDRQRLFWNKAGVPDRDITILGQPRSDLFYSEKSCDMDSLFPKRRPIVTFFSYMTDAYIPVELVAAEGLTWDSMRGETHAEIFRLASLFPNYNFVVKTHPQQPDLGLLQAMYELPNLRIIGGSAVSNELIQRSELIIAFQTTAVIEAMLLGRRVIYTYWSELLSRLEKDLLPFHTAPGIHVSRSLADCRETCERVLAGDASMFEFPAEIVAARNDFVDQYFWRPDGHVCERFFESIGRFIS